MRSRIVIAVLLGFVLPLAAISCGGGGSGGGNGDGGLAVSDLEGTWYGVVEDSSADLWTFEMTFDASGNMSDIYIDDVLQVGLTGTASHDSGNIFGFVLSDTTEGVFMANGGGAHAGYLDEDWNIAVLEKAASNVPSYAFTDFQGIWNGYSLTVDAGMAVADLGSTTMTVDAMYDIAGTVLTGAFEGYLWDWEDAWGVAWGWDDLDVYYFEVLMSPDKNFVTTYSCEDLGSWAIQDCEFGVWSRQ